MFLCLGKRKFDSYNLNSNKRKIDLAYKMQNQKIFCLCFDLKEFIIMHLIKL